MNKFEDVCPICGQEIAKEAVERGDAVICPDCGTSYHKACWEKAGGCVTFACPSKPKVQTQTQQPYQQQEQQQQMMASMAEKASPQLARGMVDGMNNSEGGE